MLSLAIDNGRPATLDARRRALLAKVHIARKALAMEADDYRALLARVTRRNSAADCTVRELGDIVAEFERLGFKADGRQRPQAGGAVARKARALWISLYQLGAIVDPSEKALEAFGRRQLGIERLQWANERLGYRLIEALKAIAERHGWDQTVPSSMPPQAFIRLLKDRLVGAQLARLAEVGAPERGELAGDRAGWPEKRLETVSAELGARLRGVAGEA